MGVGLEVYARAGNPGVDSWQRILEDVCQESFADFVASFEIGSARFAGKIKSSDHESLAVFSWFEGGKHELLWVGYIEEGLGQGQTTFPPARLKGEERYVEFGALMCQAGP